MKICAENPSLVKIGEKITGKLNEDIKTLLCLQNLLFDSYVIRLKVLCSVCPSVYMCQRCSNGYIYLNFAIGNFHENRSRIHKFV